MQHNLSLIVDLQPFTQDFLRANIYKMISPNMLHQLIKGIFKDHLVTWVCDYLYNEHGETQADVILDDIDRWYITLRTHLALAVAGSNMQ